MPGLRPTHDRIRETLFNWLMNDIRGAVCLDLFAGSGALGFEALSRGASWTTFVDSARQVLDALHENSKKFNANNCDILYGTFPQRMPLLKHAPYDIVFLDPPFAKNLLLPTISYLQENKILKAKALVYMESSCGDDKPILPSNWECLKYKTTTTVVYSLFQVQRRNTEFAERKRV